MTERYFHANQEALSRAAGALPAIGANNVVALPAPTRLDAAKAAYGALSAEEREAFKKWLAEQG